jgi:hypothetical protein
VEKKLVKNKKLAKDQRQHSHAIVSIKSSDPSHIWGSV